MELVIFDFRFYGSQKMTSIQYLIAIPSLHGLEYTWDNSIFQPQESCLFIYVNVLCKELGWLHLRKEFKETKYGIFTRSLFLTASFGLPYLLYLDNRILEAFWKLCLQTSVFDICFSSRSISTGKSNK